MTLVDQQKNAGVMRLTLNRPEKLNAMNPQLIIELTEGLRQAMRDDEVSVVVISGAGRAFSAGADSKAESEDKEFSSRLKNAPVDMAETRLRVEEWLRLKALPKPIIAQVHGYCLGLANELVGCADLVVCSQGARFGMPEVREVGLFPTLGFWPQRIGIQRTFELLMTGRLVEGEEAASLGLALQCVPDDQLESTVGELANSLASMDLGRMMVTKAAINCWLESAGYLEAARRGSQFHALYHQAGH